MFNPIAYGDNELTTTLPTISLGYGPNQIAPPRLIVLSGAGGQTVLLPPIATVMPTPPGTPGPIVGAGGGFEITIKPLGATAPTLTPYGSDVIYDTITWAAGVPKTLQVGADGKWYWIG